MSAIASAPPVGCLTYTEYLSEQTISERYDIIEGERRILPSPTWRHQRIQGRLLRAFQSYEDATGSGYCLAAPFDVLIRRVPRLQVRQPDLLFISKSALTQSGGIPERVPLETAPELVVEILSDSDRKSVLSGKITDYLTIGVREVWLMRPDVQTVEILNLTSGQAVSETLFSASETAESRVFMGLKVEVAGLFQA